MQVHTSICYDVNIVKCYHDGYNCELAQQLNSVFFEYNCSFHICSSLLKDFFYILKKSRKTCSCCICQCGLLTLKVHISMDKNIYSIFVNEKFVTVHSLYMDAHCSSLLCNCHGDRKLYFKITHICSFRFHLLGDLMFLSCKNLGDWVLGGSYGCINVLCWWVWTRFLASPWSSKGSSHCWESRFL